MADNQLHLNGNPAWRVYRHIGAPYYVAEPYFSEPKLGELALTIFGAYRYFGDGVWELHPESNPQASAVLRFMLEAKAGWDNEREQLKAQIGDLTDQIDEMFEQGEE